MMTRSIHYALRNAQILELIATWIAKPEEPGLAYIMGANRRVQSSNVQKRTSAMHNLYAFVRTCKPFYRAGLCKLWAQQSTLDNLMRCLPSSEWILHKSGLVVCGWFFNHRLVKLTG